MSSCHPTTAPRDASFKTFIRLGMSSSQQPRLVEKGTCMSTMTPNVLRAVALAASVVLGGTVDAADQVTLGKRLLIKNPSSGAVHNKIVHFASDAAITVGVAGGLGDPQCTAAGGGGTSYIRMITSGGAGDAVIPLPSERWTTDAANSLYKYTDQTGGTCKLVLVRAGKYTKALCGGSQVAIDVDASMSPVAVVTKLNTETYCTEFGGVAVKNGSDDRT